MGYAREYKNSLASFKKRQACLFSTQLPCSSCVGILGLIDPKQTKPVGLSKYIYKN